MTSLTDHAWQAGLLRRRPPDSIASVAGRAGASALAGNSTEIVHGLAAARHEAAWRKLAAQALEPSPLLAPAVALAAMRHLSGRANPRVILVRDAAGRRLIGLFPVVLPRLPLGPRLARFWRPPLQGFGTPLLHRDHAAEALGALITHLSTPDVGVDGVLFRHLALEGPAAQAIRAVARQRGLAVTPLSPGQRRLWTQAPAAPAAEVAGTPAEVRRAIERFLVLEAEACRQNGQPSLLEDAGTATFLRAATRALAHEGLLRLRLTQDAAGHEAMALLILAGQPANAEQARAHLWRSAFHPAFALAERPAAAHRLVATEPGLGTLLDASPVADPLALLPGDGTLPTGDLLLAFSSKARAAICGRERLKRALGQLANGPVARWLAEF
jgi:hypothetical protein